MADATSAHPWGNADAYEAYMGRWSRPVAEAALAWLGPSPGLSWLDVGCGTGALTAAILDAADPREVLGVDPSADFLATAAKQIADPRVRFAVGDAPRSRWPMMRSTRSSPAWSCTSCPTRGRPVAR